ncbi:glycine betaine ABC transporter substrate-binding protein [Thiohalospira sp.]|uniref:glycine betaine ABC transporter substrate-binding protein n=1 Tax=Thiohalospira sp. TaxID=3080549 RepID=UPI0039805CCE
MMKQTLKWATAAMAGVGLAFSAQAEPVKIGWTAWSDAEFVTKLTKRILEERLDQEVELTQTDIAPQYQGLAGGDIDMMLMSWQPGTHEDYIEKHAGDFVNLGPLYTHAKLGWIVPDYIPESEISSIEDLKKDSVREKLDGTITGIDPGAGLTRLSKDALEDYGLDGYELQTSSGSAMTAALERAARRDEWIVVTGWSPHWKFGAYDLRYLEDPEGSLGGAEHIDALTRKGFYQDNVEVASVVSRIQIPLEMLQDYMYQARESSYEEAVDAFMEEQSQYVDYWVTGEL